LFDTITIEIFLLLILSTISLLHATFHNDFP